MTAERVLPNRAEEKIMEDTDWTHAICMKQKDSRGTSWIQIGVGWMNDKGHLKLKLNMGVTLSWHDLDNYSVSVFPRRAQP